MVLTMIEVFIVFVVVVIAAVMAVPMVVSLPQLVVVWAVFGPGPLVLRVILPVGVLVPAYAFWPIFGVPGDLIALEMLNLALVLWLAKGIHFGTFQFTLGQVMLATTACAVLAVLLAQVPIGHYLPPLEILAAASTIPAVTVVSIWAALSPRPLWQRFGVATLLGLGFVVSIDACFAPLSRRDPDWNIDWAFLASVILGLHSLIVVGIARWWTQEAVVDEWHLSSTS